MHRQQSFKRTFFKLFFQDNKTLQTYVTHPADVTRSLVLMFDFGLDRMLSGFNNEIAFSQTRIRAFPKSIRHPQNIFLTTSPKQTSLQNVIQSFSPEDEDHFHSIDLIPPF